MSTTPLLSLRSVSRSYGATRALSEVGFDLRAGEVHALMGENGAGKSTLMKILAGNVARDSGSIRIDGEEVAIDSPRDAAALGIAIIHQELNTVPSMTVAENLALGREPRTRWGTLDRDALVEQARLKLSVVDADIDPRRPLGELSVGMQQMVEIARAVSENARVIVMDEPTAALSLAESEQLYDVIQQRRRAGVGIVYISHRMEEVWRLADRVTVFRDGKLVGTRERDGLVPDDVVQMMVGRKLENLYRPDRTHIGDVVLEVDTLEGLGVGPASFTVRAGEVVALAGLIGAGRSELVRCVFGADPTTSGTVRVDGCPVRHDTPAAAILAGVAMLPESRKDQALFLDHSVEDNIAISALATMSRGGVLRRRTITARVAEQMERLHIRSNARKLPVRALSGGNQQKAAMARWLLRDARVVILDEPTRGVDVGARSEIYDVINQMRRQGRAVVVVSSDLPEAIGVSDRLLVMRHGAIVAELDSATTTEHDAMSAATGTHRDREALR